MASSSTLSMLPHDLIREILYRTPAESLVRSMMTCKQWNNLINAEDKSFIYEHLTRSKEKFLRTEEKVQIMDPVTSKFSESPMPDELQPYTIIASVHCNGIMLCMCSDMSSKFGNLALWNPLTRKFSWVDEPSREGFVISDHFGIGYNVNEPHRYDYKILKFSDRLNEVEIYECMSKSWRVLDDAKVDWKIYTGCNGVFVKGNMYWLANKDNRNYVLGFDFSDETFKDICFCRLPYENNYLGCYDGDKLSLLEQNQDEPSPIEVWVSSKLADIGNVSFVQYFKVEGFNLPALRFSTYTAHPVYCIAKDKRIIAWCEDDVNDELDWVSSCITLYEIDGARVSTKHEIERHHGDDYVETFFCGYVYVPSLVPLPV